MTSALSLSNLETDASACRCSEPFLVGANNKKIISGSSNDAYQTLKTVELIYEADIDWRQKINQWENDYECIS